jgi:hypothetical protein
VTVDRGKFPAEGPVSFSFRLSEEIQLTVTEDLR